ncbi:MAG: rRNA pseudouridine synthase [Xanthobacteraceae bacterium]|nr:rRNA pseudouridine synthase [Xanthobacteraceae bacterium]
MSRPPRQKPKKGARPSPASEAGGHGERIAKVMARAGLCSRRDAEDWIAAGRVGVNGQTIATPAVNVTARDRVTVDGKPLRRRERTRLFLYNKPVGLVTTNADPQGRPTVFDALPAGLPRLMSVGRLDIGTEGLLLLTNDGGLARVLELPDTQWLRRYRVRAHGRIGQAELDRLRDGISVDGVNYGPIEASLEHEQGSNVWLGFAIREGKNREVRNVLGALGLQVNRLIRIAFGPFELGDLREGTVAEVKTPALRAALGEAIVAQAGCDFSSPVIAQGLGAASREERRKERYEQRRVIRQREHGERAPARLRDERHPRGRDGPRREGNEPTGERDRTPREDRPRERDRMARGRDRITREGDRSPRDRDERPRTGKPFRRDRARDDARPEKPPGRPRRGHAWRQDDAPLRQTYRGSRRADLKIPDEDRPDKRAGLLEDRKGRRILVERFGTRKPKPEAKPAAKAPGRRDQRRRRTPDRASGPRPSRPKPREDQDR